MKQKRILAIFILSILSSVAVSATYNSTEKGESEELSINDSDFHKNDDKQVVFGYLKANEFVKARQEIDKLLKKRPEDTNLYILQAAAYQQEGNKQAVEESYKRILVIDKRNIVALHGLASIAIKKGELEKAKKYHEKILLINDVYVKSYMALAKISGIQGDLIAAQSYLLKGIENTAGNIGAKVDLVYALSKNYARQKKPYKAIEVANKLLIDNANNVDVLSFYVYAYLLNNKVQQAEKVLRQLFLQEPNETKHRVFLANILSKQIGREKDLLSLLDEIINLAPEKIQSYVFKVNHLISKKLYQKALSESVLVDKAFPEFSIGKQLKAQVYLAEKNIIKGIESYKKAYQQQPDDKLLFILVDLMIKNNQHSDALSLVKKQIGENPEKTVLKLVLADIYVRNHNVVKAIENYELVLKESPNNVKALNNVAWAYYKQDNPAALSYAYRAYQLAPENAAVTDTYGYLLVKQGEIEEGMQILKKTVVLAPSVKSYQFHLADAYAIQGNKSLAITILDAILKDGQLFSGKESAEALVNKLR